MTRLAALLACLMASGAVAQTSCAPRAQVVDRLEVKYGETFLGGGLRNAESVFEVWLSEEKRTWTILLTRSDGVSCIMASGTNWVPGAFLIPGVPG